MEELPSPLASHPAQPTSPQRVQQQELQAQQNLQRVLSEVQPTVSGGSGAGACNGQDEGLSNAEFEWGVSSASGGGVVRKTLDEICTMLGLDNQFTM
jgi:hypothetical protein